MALTKISRSLLDTGVSDSSDATAITIDSSENVGIGTTSPAEKLEVNGNIKFGDGHTIGDGAGDNLTLTSSAGENIVIDSTGGITVISSNGTEKMRATSDGTLLIGTTTTDITVAGTRLYGGSNKGVMTLTSVNMQALYINRSNDGTLVEFRSAGTAEGTISVSGSTVSYNGFSGTHESSGISSDITIGTVVSTIDELDTYPDTQKNVEGSTEEHPKKGQNRKDHAKIKVSDTSGDSRVYGVLERYDDNNKPVVASVGIGSVRVTGACNGGDLLESNGDGTAKVQDDDIIRSKTIGKVTIGNSNTDVKLVACVLYCG